MPHPIAYLGFNGNCADAMRFYERALDGKLEILMTNGQSPVASHCPPDSHDRIMHARLALPGGGILMAGDCPGNLPYDGIKGVAIALNYDTVDEAKQRFQTLAEGGQITMPLQETFWAKIWGMAVDRYGTPWIINGELLPM